MSDASVHKGSGKSWAEWVALLDNACAAEKSHGEIASFVSSLGTPAWWSQMVTVGYERIRGLRTKGQRRDGGYEASKSRTFQRSAGNALPRLRKFTQAREMAAGEDFGKVFRARETDADHLGRQHNRATRLPFERSGQERR